jgi:hypothetical protein
MAARPKFQGIAVNIREFPPKRANLKDKPRLQPIENVENSTKKNKNITQNTSLHTISTGFRLLPQLSARDALRFHPEFQVFFPTTITKIFYDSRLTLR